MIFSGTLGLSNTNDLSVGFTLQDITFDRSAGAFTLSGSGFSLLNSIVNNSTSSQTIALPIILSSSASTLLTAASGNLVFKGILSGSATGGLMITGPNTVVLTNTNTYAGGTTLKSGTLSVASNANLGSGALTLAGGTLALTGTAALARAITVSGTSRLDVGTNNVIVSGSISGSSTLVKSGAGMLTIQGVDPFAGLLQLGSGTTNLLGSASSSIDEVESGATLQGTGTAGGLKIDAGGILAPGIYGSGAMTALTAQLAAGSMLSLTLGGTSAGACTELSLSGTASLAGSLTATFSSLYAPVNPVSPANPWVIGGANTSFSKFFIIVGGAPGGNFSNQVTTGNEYHGAVPTIYLNGREFIVDYTASYASNSATGGHDVALIPVIPEPELAKMAMLCLGAQLVARRARRTRCTRCALLMHSMHRMGRKTPG